MLKVIKTKVPKDTIYYSLYSNCRSQTDYQLSCKTRNLFIYFLKKFIEVIKDHIETIRLVRDTTESGMPDSKDLNQTKIS